jgi:uncharacterized protein (UPF0297 family)
MSWNLLISLMAQFGPAAFDLAKKLIEKWNSSDPVTLIDIEELRSLGRRTSRDALVESLVRAGIPLDSPQAVALLAMVP